MAFVAAGTLFNAEGATAVVTIPSHSNGDILVLSVGMTAGGSPQVDIVTPTTSGLTWVQKSTAEAGAASAVRMSVWTAEGNGVATSVLVVADGASENPLYTCQVLAFSLRSGVVEVATATVQDSGVDINSPDITPSTVGADIVRAYIFDDAESTDADHDSDANFKGTSSGYGEGDSPGNGHAAAFAHQANVAQSATGTSTWSSNADDDGGVATTIALLKLVAGISAVNPFEFDMDNADIDIVGVGFGSSIGASDVYLSPNDLLSESGEVDITAAVNTWSDTVINLDLTLLSQGVLDSLQSMGPGARFIIVNVGGVPATTEYFKAVTLHRPVAFQMVLGNIVPGTTTSRLTGMTGTFGGGRAEETAAQNPSTTDTDVVDDGNREDVWSIEAKPLSRDTQQYDFRVLYNGVVPDTITQTPQVTIAVGGAPAIDIYPQTSWWGLGAFLLAAAAAFHEPAGFTEFDDRPFNTLAIEIFDPQGYAEGWADDEWSGTNQEIEVHNDAPLSPSNVLAIRYPEGKTGSTASFGGTTLTMANGNRKLYHRFGMKISTNFQGHLTSTNKIFHMWQRDGEGGFQNGFFYSMEGQDLGTLIFRGRMQGLVDVRDNLPPNVGAETGEIVRNQWYLIEVLLELSSVVGGVSQGDGIYKLWMDGVLTSDYSDVDWYDDEDSAHLRVELSPTWGGSGDEVEEDMYLYIDHNFVSIAP